MFCTECPGVVSHEDSGEQFATEFGTLGAVSLPPAGVQERTPTEMKDAADVWTNLDILAASAGVCSRCSGRIEHSVTVCENHDGTEEMCEYCDQRYAASFEIECAACHYNKRGIAIVCLLAETELLSFLTGHGLNPLVPETRERAPGMLANYDEEVHSLDPLRVDLTFTIDDDALTLTIDEGVSVLDVAREQGPASD